MMPIGTILLKKVFLSNNQSFLVLSGGGLRLQCEHFMLHGFACSASISCCMAAGEAPPAPTLAAAASRIGVDWAAAKKASLSSVLRW